LTGASRRVVLVKLGGSLLTDKRRTEAFRPGRTHRAAREIAGSIAGAGGRVVLGHGAGSFGHAAAARHGIGAGPVRADGALGIAEVQDRTARLHRLVVAALLRSGVPAYSLAPASFMVARRGTMRLATMAPLLGALESGMVPVVFGDVVTDSDWRAAICSTESAFLAIARGLLRRGIEVERAVWVGTTDGVLDGRGRPIRRIVADRRARYAARHAGASDGTDVTGGMRHRLDAALALARLGIPSWIGDGTVPGRLRDALRGERVPGTRVVPS